MAGANYLASDMAFPQRLPRAGRANNRLPLDVQSAPLSRPLSPHRHSCTQSPGISTIDRSLTNWRPEFSSSVALIFKRVVQWIGMPARYVASVSGHSTRGATQDLAVLDIDLAAITQAGGWRSPRMPLQYAEKIQVELARADDAASVKLTSPWPGV